MINTCLEFFAGIGLMRIGLEKCGWNVLFANDIDPLKYKMYADNFSDAPTHFAIGDIHQLDLDLIPNATLATASFPCTDLSLAGSRDGLSGKHSSAFWGFVGVLERLGQRRPQIVMLENVTGFLTSNDGRDFEHALTALNRLGYRVDAFVVNAADFVPQSRQRLFVIGSRTEGHANRVRSPVSFYESDLRPRQLADFIYLHPEIDWSIRSLPPILPHALKLPDLLETISHGSQEWWSAERASYLLSQMSPRHRVIADKMIAGQDWSYGTVFRRVRNGRSMAELRVDGVAGCLRTPKGGSGRQILFQGGRGQYHVRLLTPRECARLMGADDFRLDVPLNQALFGFGDAVCVPVISWIADSYLNPLVQELALPFSEARVSAGGELCYA
jgi:DNA (cytosine-5)-methyltransferase 1